MTRKYGDSAGRKTRALIHRHADLLTIIEDIILKSNRSPDILYELLDIERELTLREHE